jgi:hypothetical protein
MCLLETSSCRNKLFEGKEAMTGMTDESVGVFSIIMNYLDMCDGAKTLENFLNIIFGGCRCEASEEQILQQKSGE